jgi:hypothetical protein
MPKLRADSVGIFWDDTPAPKPPKIEKVKRTPPEPVWLSPDYLPGLEEALQFPVQLMTHADLVDAATKQDELIVDVECFPNYFLVCFQNRRTGAVFYLETVEGGPPLNGALLKWILTSFTTVGFNSLDFDIPMCQLAIAGNTPATLKSASNLIIQMGLRGWKVLRQFKVKKLNIDHFDLIEVAPLRASLKTYAGRLHAPKMQDLPFHHTTVLSFDQIAIVRWYCVNDTTNTKLLRNHLDEHIRLRYSLGRQYHVDVRSRSDAQIAEAVIAAELTRFGSAPQKPSIGVGTSYLYRVPSFIRYETPLLNWALDIVSRSYFVVDETGSIGLPQSIKDLKLEINGAVYRMGIGGLHSSEKRVVHRSDDLYMVVDKDVVSYYPYIILNLGLAPQHLGLPFLDVYRSIVERRVNAKKQGDKTGADGLKIVVNGSFGKLGSKYSILYSPDLLIQVTITGQLALLLLIERLELAGLHVASANTDGVVVRCLRTERERLDCVVQQWEKDTGFETEEAIYRAIYMRDVNNYIAIKEDGTTKTKGAYSEKGSAQNSVLSKNPEVLICSEAVQRYLADSVPLDTTIKECKDIGKFVSVRTVTGGAAKVWEDGHVDYLGKSVRWYYALDTKGEIVYITNGNKVPRSDGAKPLMSLPKEFPEDIDYEWYLNAASRILIDIGAVEAPAKKKRGQRG